MPAEPEFQFKADVGKKPDLNGDEDFHQEGDASIYITDGDDGFQANPVSGVVETSIDTETVSLDQEAVVDQFDFIG